MTQPILHNVRRQRTKSHNQEELGAVVIFSNIKCKIPRKRGHTTKQKIRGFQIIDLELGFIRTLKNFVPERTGNETSIKNRTFALKTNRKQETTPTDLTYYGDPKDQTSQPRWRSPVTQDSYERPPRGERERDLLRTRTGACMATMRDGPSSSS